MLRQRGPPKRVVSTRHVKQNPELRITDMTEDVHLVTAQVKTASKFGPKKAADDISDEWKSQYNGSLGAND